MSEQDKYGKIKTSSKSGNRKFYFSCGAMDQPTSSPSDPNVEQTVKCVCKQINTLLSHSCRHPKANPKVIPVFCEDLQALNVHSIQQLPVPDLGHMQIFMLYILKQLHMNSQCCVICLVYLERLITDALVVLHPINWRRFVVIGLLMASKIWDDHSVHNSSIIKNAFPFFTVKDINDMEREFLTLLDFNLTISPKEYLEYYFSLRSLGGIDIIQLKVDELQQLETKSTLQGDSSKKRFQSFDASRLPQPGTGSSSSSSNRDGFTSTGTASAEKKGSDE